LSKDLRSPREQNDSYLTRLWGTSAVPLAFGILGLLVALATGGSSSALVLVAVVSSIGTFFWWQLGRIRRALLRPGPEEYILLMRSSAERSPKLRAQLQATTAMGTALYERAELAEEQLSSIDWEKEPPMTRASAELTEALVHYCRGEWTEGWARARHAATLGVVDERFPGATTSSLAFSVHTALGAVLCGQERASTRATLDEGASSLPLFGKLFAHWGARVLALREHRQEDAERHTRFLSKHAPHCTLLYRVPNEDESPGTG
jgi:hypothetical protein